MQNIRNVRMPQGNAPGRLAGLIIGGGALLYGVSNSLFNVEGGHRAIVFNRVTGIKEQVCLPGHDTWEPAVGLQTTEAFAFSDRCMRKVHTLCFLGLTGPSFTMSARDRTSSKARPAPKTCKW